jgi:hypothetical protein
VSIPAFRVFASAREGQARRRISERIEVDTLMHVPTGYMFAFDVNLNRRSNRTSMQA